MNIVISGYYGYGNVGDEAVLTAIIKGLRLREPKIEILVLSASPQLTKEIHQVGAVHRYDWLKVIAAIRKADLFISGGGTLFQNSTSNRSLIYYLTLILLAKICRKKVMVLAQGFGPLKGRFYHWLTFAILKLIDLASLRDAEAFNELLTGGLNKNKLSVTADPTVTLNVPSVAAGKRLLSLEGIKPGTRPLLAVAVRNMLLPSRDQYFAAIAKTIDWFSQKYDYYPLFLLFQCPEDMSTAAKIIGQMKENSTVIFRICQPDEMLAIISQCDLLLAMRLHALIFAAICEVPLLGLAYDPKVESFMKDIEQPYLRFDNKFSYDNLKQALEQVMINRLLIKQNLSLKRKVLYQQAELNFDLLMSLK